MDCNQSVEQASIPMGEQACEQIELEILSKLYEDPQTQSVVSSLYDEVQNSIMRRTPLRIAARKYSAQVIALLLDHGAHACLSSRYNKRILFESLQNHDTECFKLLAKAGASRNGELVVGEMDIVDTLVEGTHCDLLRYVISLGFPLGTNPKRSQRNVFENPYDLNTLYFSSSDFVRKEGEIASDLRYGIPYLCLAAYTLKPEVVGILIEAGANVNECDRIFGQTPLVWALRRVHELGELSPRAAEVIRQLIAGGASLPIIPADYLDYYPLDLKTIATLIPVINAQDDYGLTALAKVIFCEDVQCIKAFLEAGADVNAKDYFGSSVLMDYVAICMKNDVPIMGNPVVNLLVAERADLNLQDASGDTILHLLAESADLDDRTDLVAIEQFITWGADPAIRNEDGDTPLGVLVGNLEDFWDYDDLDWSVFLKVGGLFSNCTDEKAKSAFFKLILQSDSSKVLKHFIKLGAALTALDEEGDSVLHLALLFGDEEFKFIRILVEAGADVNVQNSKGQTPLALYLCRYTWDEEYLLGNVKYLLDAGTNVNLQDANGQTILMHALTEHDEIDEHDDLLEMILDHGADYEFQDNEGKTALMHAVINENEIAVRKLLRCQPDLLASDRSGSTAITYAMKGSDASIRRMLTKYAQANQE